MLQPLKEDKFVIPKSRYDTIDCFLTSDEYNDREVLYDQAVFQQLMDGGKWSCMISILNRVISKL